MPFDRLVLKNLAALLGLKYPNRGKKQETSRLVLEYFYRGLAFWPQEQLPEIVLGTLARGRVQEYAFSFSTRYIACASLLLSENRRC